MSRPNIQLSWLAEILHDLCPELSAVSTEVAKAVTIEAKYSTYLKMQAHDIARFRDNEDLLLPAELDYSQVGALSAEEQEKLVTYIFFFLALSLS